MAEILLSLTIIGVVAAITLPSLTGNINERTWNTQRKALYARFSQAIALMPALNGYGTLTAGDSSTSAVDTAAETFVTDGLSKVLKINNICDSEHLEDCGIPAKLTTIAGSNLDMPRTLVNFNKFFNGSFSYSNGINVDYSQIDTKAAAFETANGESILTYYSPNCVSNPGSNSFKIQTTMCANFVYDLNGNKGPNTVGKDIGVMTVFYPVDPVVVAPMPLNKKFGVHIAYEDAVAYCKNQDVEGRLPNVDELSSLFVNQFILNDFIGDAYISSSKEGSDVWVVAMYSGARFTLSRSAINDATLHCIKRY